MTTSRMTPEQRKRQDTICRMFNDGTSIAEIARHYGRSTSTISAILQRGKHSGLITRTVVSTEARDAEILGLLAEGKSQSEVAKIIGLCLASINRIVVSQPGYLPRQARPAGMGKGAFNTMFAPAKEAAVKVAPAPKPTPQKPIIEQRSNAELIAEFLAVNKPKICPPVALNPTQASLSPNPELSNPWAGKTTWPASEKGYAKARKRGSRGLSSLHPSNRSGAVL